MAKKQPFTPPTSLGPLANTGKRITHRGQEFAIFTTEDSRADSKWVLVSNTGITYALTRNRNTPTALFGVDMGATMRVLKGWFSDKGGELVSRG